MKGYFKIPASDATPFLHHGKFKVMKLLTWLSHVKGKKNKNKNTTPQKKKIYYPAYEINPQLHKRKQRKHI